MKDGGHEPSTRIGQCIGNYRVVRQLGEGGMGVVYEAEHEQIGRRAAIKVLHAELSRDPEITTRFLNEARAANLVQHSGIVGVFEFGQLEDGADHTAVVRWLERLAKTTLGGSDV